MIVLDSCYQADLAERISRTGPAVIGLPGRLGRGQATDFARTWYARYAGQPLQESFDQAMGETRFHRLPDAVQPQLHHQGAPEPVRFRGPPGAQPREVTVWYGTNRPPRPGHGDSYWPEPHDALHLGSCVIHVPASVPVGKSRARRARGSAGPRQYVEVSSQAMDSDTYLAGLRAALAGQDAGDRSIVVYVHGYRTHFTEAATRAAQLHSDLNNPGQMAFFSWPSAGAASGYFTDGQRPARGALLASVPRPPVPGHRSREGQRDRPQHGQPPNATRGHAHRGRHSRRLRPEIRPRLPGGCGCQPAVLLGRSRGVSSGYISDRDRALKSSGIVHTGDRAGLTPPLTLVEGVDTIDASEVDLTLLGHAYYADARPVLSDMHAVPRGQHRPESRFGIERQTAPEGGAYWRFRP